MRKVVITGVGLALPGARTTEQFWELVGAGRPAVTEIDRFPTGQYTARRAGTAGDEAVASIPLRLRKRMDRFCQLALVAAQDALAAAGLDPADAPEGVGVYLGNMYGGWEITEESMRRLCRVGYTGVSPYIASAWFPTAPQGQISIKWGIKGFSKTVAADTASAAVAVGYAARAIAEGRADAMLAGGAEAPVTPYTYTFCETSGRLTPGDYRPFGAGADGFLVGEGAVVLTLEAEESARARGAEILAEVAGFAAGHASSDQVFGRTGTDVLTHVAQTALKEAEVVPQDLDLIALDAQGTVYADAGEVRAVQDLLGAGAVDRVPCTTVKPVTGHLLGAAPAVDLLAALLAIRHGAVPPVAGITAGEREATELDLVVDAPRVRPVRSALVNARGADGTVAALVLRGPAGRAH
ncbi:beta-ketoacyl synthase N-terminal-like domain-containing protein [Kitasatospora sp. NPDC001539]|uniref:beta-ketoacyl-[acyl-carrier-protein] synthase family protein n=1 Tax=Kitasatospora sp. NPDC001539 TaxID=3154384 RepID=UPI00332D17BD